MYFLSILTSIRSASYFRRSESLRWTSYLEECIRLLEDVKEYPTDSLLVFLTKVQLIDNQAVDSASGYITGETNVLPAGIYSKILTSQLDDLKSSIPVELQSNCKSFYIPTVLLYHSKARNNSLCYFKILGGYFSLSGSNFEI